MEKQSPIKSPEDFVLAALSVQEAGYEYTPVQVQKILFLLDDIAGEELNSKRIFNFIPYNYGPYDKKVISVLEESEKKELVAIIPGDWRVGYRRFTLTEYGRSEGQKILGALPKKVSNFVGEMVQWVVNLGFQDLIRSIYTNYPEMQANSIFTKPVD